VCYYRKMKENPYPGKFIIFDGLDGSGLSTQASLLVDFLNEKTKNLKLGYLGAYLTKEPTKNLIGGLINAQLSHAWKSSPECLQLLFSADRAFHLEKEIIPLLEKGVIVVCDRYLFSTLAFGSVEITDFDWLLNLQKNFLIPDLTFFLKVSPKVCVERIQKTRFEITLFEEQEVFEKVWKNFEMLSKKFENIYVLDGERPINEISQEIKEIIKTKIL